jgi:hypothetical protein
MMKHNLWEALDLLREKGWCQGQAKHPLTGALCMAGAVIAADRGKIVWRDRVENKLLQDTITALHPNRSVGFFSLGDLSVALFNDDPETTWEMVETIMEKAAIRGDEIVDDERGADKRYVLGEHL